MDREKRRSPRIRCRIPCEVRWSGGTSEATVRDVSAGGLSLQSSIAPAEGESLRVQIQLKHGRKVEVDGLVWHRHRVRTRDGATGTLLGLVVSNPPEAFLELSRQPHSLPAAPPAAAEAPAPQARAIPDAPEGDPNEDTLPPVPDPGRRFQVRMKQDASPRSRVLSIEADSADEATALALERTGSGWAAIEVNAV
jgi:hypothetical protein